MTRSRGSSRPAIAGRVREALRCFDPAHVWLNPDCGFGTFAERPVSNGNIASAKLRAMCGAAARLRTTVSMVP